MSSGPEPQAGGGPTPASSAAGSSSGEPGSDPSAPGAGAGSAPGAGSGAGPVEGHPGLLAAVDALQARPVDHLDEPALSEELQLIELATRRLQARSTRLVAALVERRAIRARDAGDGRAARNATRRTQRELRDELGWTPSEARRATEVGGQLGGTPDAQEALDAGRLPVRHAALLAETLRFVEDEQVSASLEQDLLAAAESQDAVTFGRTCRRALATADHRAAERADARRRRRRSARAWQTEDGMYAMSGQWSGLDGETVATAVHAFRRPNAAGEDRTPQQATADAFVELARAALRAGEAPTEHGVRPHVIVTIPWAAVLDGYGVAEASWTGPLPFHEVRRLLADCGVARLLVDPDGVPVEAGEAVRTVPAGLYRALRLRDGGCIADGCDVPASWCQIMHLDVPFRFQGRLTVETAALGCSEHHDRFDRRGWVITWIDGRPIMHHPDRPPRRAERAAPGAVSNPASARPTGGSEPAPRATTDDGSRSGDHVGPRRDRPSDRPPTGPPNRRDRPPDRAPANPPGRRDRPPERAPASPPGRRDRAPDPTDSEAGRPNRQSDRPVERADRRAPARRDPPVGRRADGHGVDRQLAFDATLGAEHPDAPSSPPDASSDPPTGPSERPDAPSDPDA